MVNMTPFFSHVEYPLAVVSTLQQKDRRAVIDFLLELDAPVYLEAISGIREESSLKHLRITNIDHLWYVSSKHGYKIDGILRLGGVPTLRPWRDLEDTKQDVVVCSISTLPFSGLSSGGLIHVPSMDALKNIPLPQRDYSQKASDWLEVDRQAHEWLHSLFIEEPCSEPSLIYKLSCNMEENSLLYLGNSLPIREWDMASTYQQRNYNVYASRGLNGIDGQVSTFLGMALPGRSNWGVFGDLTMLYDLAGPWILEQLRDLSANIVVVNNQGGKIFSKIFPLSVFQNPHTYNFEHIAKHWKIEYCKWEKISEDIGSRQNRLIELVPNHAATERFWKKYNEIKEHSLNHV